MTLSGIHALIFAALLVLGLIGPATAAGKLYVSCSTPDNQLVSDWPPVDSPATVQAMFEWLHDTWGVSRVYWRGGQARMWLAHGHFRPEHPSYFEWWTGWLRHLYGGAKTDHLALRAARQLGMEMVMVAPLFDYGRAGRRRRRCAVPLWHPGQASEAASRMASCGSLGRAAGAGTPEFCYPNSAGCWWSGTPSKC